MDYLLTPQEIIEARQNTIDGVNGAYEAVAKAQLAKVQPYVADMEAECEARIEELKIKQEMELNHVRKETAEQIFKELEKRFGLFVDRKLEKLVIDDSNYYSIGKMEWYKAIKSKYGIEG